MKKSYIYLITTILSLLTSFSCQCRKHDLSQKKKSPEFVFLGEETDTAIMGQYWIDDGRRTVFIRGGHVIPNAKTAVEVAKPILYNEFGKEKVDKDLPFNVELINDSIWVLTGTLPQKSLGGTFHMTMLKWNGQVIAIWGEK